MRRIVLTLALILAILAGTASVALAAGNGEIAYRALMIGIDSYQTNALSGCVNDAARMSEMLLTANDAGAFYQSPTIRSNLQTDEISSLFKEIQVWGADDDDVTMFYFAGHGYMSDKGNPAIVGKDNKMLRITDLITSLDTIPGVKLVVFDCRYAESLVTDSNPQGAIEVFNTAVTDAFKSASSSASYYVLCASTLSKEQTDATQASQDYGFITYYLTQGCGYDYTSKTQLDKMEADTNDNGAVSFGEIEDYITSNISRNNPDEIFDIKTFPPSSAYPLLARRATTQVDQVTFPQAEIDIAMGKKVALEATIRPTNASMRSIYWSSSDLSVASVDDMGNIIGLKPGTAVVSVTTTNGLSESLTVTVKNIVYADSLMMNIGKLVLAPNARAKLSVTCEPADASEQVMWSSQNEAVATVDENGNVTCRQAGDTTITAYTDSGAETMCALSVTDANKVVQSVAFAKNEYELYSGETRTIQFTVKPKTAVDSTIDFISSDAQVATVSGGNILNAVAPGECVIYATASNGTTKSIDVVVKNSAIELSKKTLSLKKGKTASIKAAVKPAGSTESVSWSSSDPEVATVQNGNVKAIASGQAVITASMADGTSASCSVIVDGVAVKNIKLRPQKTKLQAGQTAQLEVTLAPKNATVQQCEWTSNKENVATVDENGVVTGVSEGSAIITVKAHNGKKAKALVKVSGTAPATNDTETAPVEAAEASAEMALDQSEISLVAGLPGQNKITLAVQNGSDTTGTAAYKWVSSNPKVAAVDKKGNVMAKSAGSATIKAVSAKKQSATCEVTVTENKVVNKKPFTDTESMLYTSARRIFYKNASTLTIEMYFENKTDSAVKVPQEGNLVLLLTDGRVLTARKISAGAKKLKSGKGGVIAYNIKVKDGEELYGLNLVGAAAEIVKEGEVPVQTVDVVGQTMGIEPDSESDMPLEEGMPNAEGETPADVNDTYADDDSFIDDPFGTDADWEDTKPNTEDFDVE